jgi:prevent-host-death family protein
MNLKNDIKPVSYVKSHIAEIIKNINENHNPIIITQNGEAKGVFIDTESYQNMRNSISLMKLVMYAENDIEKSKTVSQSDVFKEIEKKLEIIK